MSMTYDPRADAAYWEISRHPVARTQAITDRVIVDYDAEGEVVGIEVLDVAEPPEVLAEPSPHTVSDYIDRQFKGH